MAADMRVDAGRVGPVRLHRHYGEAVVTHELLGDGRANSIELVGAVTGLAQENDLRIGVAVDEAGKGRIR